MICKGENNEYIDNKLQSSQKWCNGENFMAFRTIMIFPEFKNMEVINKIRREYDPLNTLVKPHITLAFPFESTMSNSDLQEILKRRLYGIKPFSLCLQGFGKSEDKFGNYLFLNVVKGQDILADIHNQLYSNELNIVDLQMKYIPHMTVGKIKTANELSEVYDKVRGITESFETIVDAISVEMIGENEESIIIIEEKI